jgi:cystathionine gamma-lyase
MRRDSLLIRGTGDEDGEGLSPPIDRSTAFERWASKTSPYARAGSPTASQAEELLGELESAQVLTFASGMTAWSNICVALLRQGSVLVIPDSGYYEVELLAAGPLAAFGV